MLKTKKEMKGRLNELYGQLVIMRHKANGTAAAREAIAQAEGWVIALEWVLGLRRELMQDGRAGNGSGGTHIR